MPTNTGVTQATGDGSQDNNGNRTPVAASTTAELCTQGIVVAILQIIITTALPLIEYFFVYRSAQYMIFLPIINWGVMIFCGILAILAQLSRTGHLLGVHACLGTALGGAVAVANIFAFIHLRDRCDRTQFSYLGCGSCACAQSNTCKQDDIQACKTDCKAFGTDVCSLIMDRAFIISFTGGMMLLASAAPVAYSCLVLARTEYQRDKMANELMFRRNKVAAVYRDLMDGKGPRAALTAGMDMELLQIMIADMNKFGTEADKALARSTARLLADQGQGGPQEQGPPRGGAKPLAAADGAPQQTYYPPGPQGFRNTNA